MKKFFKKFGKGCGYVVLYLLVAIGTAVGVLFLSPAGGSKVSANELPVQLQQLWQNLQGEDAILINLDAEIDSSEKITYISANVKLDLSKGMDDLKVQLNAHVDMGNENFDVALYLGDGEICLDALNGKFKMKTSNVGDTISKITSLLGVDLPNLDGIDLSNLDVEMVLGFLSDLTEIKSKDGIKLAINIPMLDPEIHFNVFCDNDYNLKKIEIPQTDLSGTTLSLSANVNYPKSIQLKTPEKTKYIDISELMDMASIIFDTLKTDALGFDVDVSFEDGKTFAGNLNADLKNLKASFETEIMDLPLKVSVDKNKMFYFEFGNVYLQFAFNQVYMLNDFLMQQFNISVPVKQITQMLTAIQEKEFMKILPALSFGNKTTVEGIDLSVLEGLLHENDRYVITLRDIGHITMLTNEEKLKAISFEGLGISAKVEMMPAQKVEIDDREYADLYDFLRIANAAMNTFKQDVVFGKAKIIIDELPIYVDFSLDTTTKQLDLQISLKPFDTWIIMRYHNQKLYMKGSGVEVCFDEEETKTLLASLMASLSNGQKQEDMIEKIKSLLDPQTYENFLTNVDNEDINHFKTELLGKLLLDFEYEENLINEEYVEYLKSLSVKFESIDVQINFWVQPNFEEICDSNYENIEAIANNISNAVEYARAGQYYISLEASFEDMTACGFADYDEKGLSAELNLFIFGQNAKIRVVDNKIFLDVKNLHFQANLENWKELLAVVSEEFNVNFDDLLAKVDQVKLFLDGGLNVDILALLKNKQLSDILSKVWIEIENGDLKVTYDNLVANLNFLENKQFDLNFSCEDFFASLKTKTEKSQLSQFDEDVTYVEVSEVLRKAGKVLDYVQGGQYYVTLSGNYDNLVSFDGAVNFDQENGLEAELNISAYGQSAKIRLFGSKIYLDVKDVHLFADLKDWKTLLGIISDEFGIDFDELLGKINLNVETLEKVLSGAEKFDPKQLMGGEKIDIAQLLNKLGLEYAQNKLTIAFEGIRADIMFVENMISAADIAYADISAHVEIKDKANEISELSQGTTYSEVGEVLRKAGKVLDYVQGGQYYVTLSGNYDNLVSFDGAVNFDQENGLAAELNISAYGQSAKIRLFGTKVYVDIMEVHLVADISNWQDILSLIEREFDLKFEELHEKTEEFSREKLEGLLEKVGLVYEDGKIVLHYADLTATVNFGDDSMISFADITFDKLTASVKIQSKAGDITDLGDTSYEPIENIISKAGFVFDYVTNKEFHFNDINLTFDNKYTILGFINFDRANGLSANLSTNISDVNISAKILGDEIYLKIANLNLKFEIKDIETVLYFLRDEFKLDFVDTYQKYKWIVDMLTVDKDINFSEMTKLGEGKPLDIEATLAKLGLSLKGDVLSVTFTNPNLSAEVNFEAEKLSTISLQMEGLTLSANLKGKQDVSIGEDETYFDLIEILPVVTSIKNYVAGRKYDITANAQVFEGQTQIYDAKNIILQVDALQKLQFYADAHVYGMENTKSAGFDLNLNAAISQDYLYFDYNGLCLKLNTQGVQSILTIVCEMFGIDPSILSIITGEESQNSGIDLSSLSGLLPGVDTNNKLGLLNIIKEFSMDGKTFDIALDGSVISNSEGAENMHVQIQMGDANALEKIIIKNLYTGITANEHFNLEICFHVLKNMKQPDTSKNYIDLTGAEELIKALINTISHKTFELTGQLKINFGISGRDIKDWDVPVTVQIKLANGKPEVYAQIGAIPVVDLLVYNLNNDTPWGVPTIKNRMLYIYYKDGLVYFYRHESRQRGDSYEKRIVANLDTVMNDILYYVQWGTGFNDTIMDAIRKSLEIEHTVNLGNVINTFSKPTGDNPNYEISLNMKEITGDKNMGDMTIGIGLGKFTKQVQDGDIIEQSVVGNLTFELNMPFTDSLQLYLQSNNSDKTQNLYLELDKNFDADFESYKQLYADATYDNGETFLPDIPYDAVNGQWTKQAEREFTVTFETGRSEITENAVKGVKGTSFTLPNYQQTFEDVVHDESGAEIERTKMRFMGWYTDPNFATGTEFTKGIVPNRNVTIYGKWEMDSSASWRTATYYDSDKTYKAKQYLKIGAALEQNVENIGIKRRKNENDGFEYAVKFVGWTDEFGGEFTHIPSYSISIYAHYEKDDETSKHTLSFNTGIGPTLDSVQYYSNWDIREQGFVTAFDIYGTENEGIYEADGHIYQFEGWFFDQEFEEEFGYIIPANDITIYAKWTEITEWKFQIYDNGVELLPSDLKVKVGTKIIPYSKDKEAGEDEFMLPENVNIKTSANLQSEDDSATEWYLGFENGEYVNQTSLPSVMPNGDLTLHIRNKYHVHYTYYELEETDIIEQYFAANAGVESQGYDILIATLPKKQNKTFDAYLWQNDKIEIRQKAICVDSYDPSNNEKTLQNRIVYGFKLSNGLDISNPLVQNHDMDFSVEVDPATTQNIAWHYVKFNTNFEFPNMWIEKDSLVNKLTEIQGPGSIEKVPVLYGETFDPSKFTMDNVIYEYWYWEVVNTVDKKHYFNIVTWADDKVKSITNGMGTKNDSYKTYDKFVVKENKELFAVWGVYKVENV